MSIYPGVQAGTVEVGAATVRFYDAGVTPDDSTPVVLVHGTGGRAETHFFTLYPMLASRHRVIAIDLSDANSDTDEETAPLSTTGLARQIVELLDRVVAGQKVALVGYSLGAAIAIEVAASRSETIDSLVLLNGWARTDNELRLRLALWERLRDAGDLHSLAEFMTLNVYSRSFLNARSWNDIVQMVASYAVGPGSDRQMALNKTLDVSGRLSHVKSRTLVVGSRFDHLISFSHSLELAGGIQGSVLAELQCGHGSVTERPAEVFRLIDQFVRRIESRSENSSVYEDASLSQLNTFKG
ncbi:alpha/beta fold hydrolase [Paraburkholderia guartelaensis]|uniref:alpha/beta fold hydrolase n=1 Tax=Paraburkholderia guartelaensis TaxID=2546446 RepID=UPI002AB62870|nr:alpha/beta fold hydrolase [Paraburkholderia guartelaensis]